MSGFYTYKVKWYDDFDGVTQTSQGVTYAPSYTSAMSQIVRHYGENDIVEVTLFGLEPDDCLELSPTEITTIEMGTLE